MYQKTSWVNDMTKSHVHFVKDHPDAVLPYKAHDTDVGFDIFAVEDTWVFAGTVTKIDTGLRLADVQTHSGNTIFLKIEGRSGLASKGLFPVGGIVDPAYRGVLGVIMHNSTKNDHFFKKGDKIAQLLIYPVLAKGSEVCVDFVDSVTESDRGAAGFGSTGI